MLGDPVRIFPLVGVPVISFSLSRVARRRLELSFVIYRIHESLPAIVAKEESHGKLSQNTGHPRWPV